MENYTLLIEIQIENLPANELKTISIHFLKTLKEKLKFYKMKYDSISNFCTSRRLAVKIFKFKKNTISEKKKIIGPLIKNAFHCNGNMKEETLKWIKNNKINIKEIKKIKINEKYHFYYILEKKPEKLNEQLKKIIYFMIKNIPCKKKMIWNEEKIRFSRPIRNILVLLNEKIIPINIFGLSTNRLSYGHLTINNFPIKIEHSKLYTYNFFLKYNVMIDYEKRKEFILNEIKKIEKSINNSKVIINNSLLEEVTSLVEWPLISYGTFDKKFLKIPKKILQYVMEKNQKYFSIIDINTEQLKPYFIFIGNTKKNKIKKIINDHEKVLSSKFDNLSFFIKKDLKIPFNNRISLLKNISFRKKLGNLYEKTERIFHLSKWIAEKFLYNIKIIKKAVFLLKCDLTTFLISECPSLQGIIGEYYSKYFKELPEISLIIKEQYLPCVSGGKLPTQKESFAINIADRIDTITGIFSIKKESKNDNDPLAIRRSVIGIFRIITEKSLNINLSELIKISIQLYGENRKKDDITIKIINFFKKKILSFYQLKGINKKIIQSVLSLNLNNLLSIHKRIISLNNFYKYDKLFLIKKTYKRIQKIVNKLSKEKENVFIKYESILSKQEKKIIKKYKNIFNKIEKEEKIEDFLKIIKEIQKLCYLIEEFFKNSLINHPDKKINSNRVNLLLLIKKIFLYISDFSYL